MSTYLSAPGATPVGIQTYPKRRRGFINDAHLASMSAPRDVAPIRADVISEPCYADFLVGTGHHLQVSA